MGSGRMKDVGIAARYRIDPETLRDHPRDPGQLAAWLDGRLRAPIPSDPDAERVHRTQIGSAARMLRKLDVAEAQLARALDLAVRHGTPGQVVLARVRLAHVLQWQGRFDEANAALRRCLAELDAAGERGHFVYQHAGKCAYDFGDWATAAGHFREALRQREAIGDAELVASSRLALDAADACATAAAGAAELHRLVPGAHAALRSVCAPVVAPTQPGAAILINCRNLLLAGPAPLAAVRAIHRYHADRFDEVLDDLAGRGWLILGEGTVAATGRCLELLRSTMAAMDDVLGRLWGEPTGLLDTMTELVEAGRGTSEGDVFDALADAGHPGTGTGTGTGTANRLFTVLCAARHHRADAHAAAWLAEGLTAEGVRGLDDADPRRRRIEATTDRIAARPYRTLTMEGRRDLLAALRAVPV